MSLLVMIRDVFQWSYSAIGLMTVEMVQMSKTAK